MLLERLLDNLALSVEAFATCRVAEGWRLRLPALDWATFHYVVGGEGALADGGSRSLRLPAGSLALVPPHRPHTLAFGLPPFGDASVGGGGAASELPEHVAGSPDVDGLLVVCGRIEATYGGGPGLFDQLRDPLVLDFSDDPAMRATFKAMLEEVRSGRPGAKAMTSTLMRECLIRVLRAVCDHEECTVSWLRALEDPSLAPAVEAMLSRPHDPHSVANLAARVYMSRSAFARRFKESFDQPPLEFLRGVRLRHAATLLKKTPPLPVATVARRSGFASRSHFSRRFRELFGYSPTEFRSGVEL